MDDFDGEEQPGYGYVGIWMKAHPLGTLLLVHNLSKMVEKMSELKKVMCIEDV
jgi:hypothetical protein